MNMCDCVHVCVWLCVSWLFCDNFVEVLFLEVPRLAYMYTVLFFPELNYSCTCCVTIVLIVLCNSHAQTM